MKQDTVAIIGAGMAGLACGRRLRGQGWKVRLFDKARGPGGRMSTRRVTLPDGREVHFDHGAQFITTRDPAFASVMTGLVKANEAAPFPWPIFSQSPRGATSDSELSRYVGVGGMNAIPKALAASLSITLQRQVTTLTRLPAGGWRLGFADGSTQAGFAAVVVATPAEQAGPLVQESSTGLAAEARAARTVPCWAGLFAFEGGGEPAFGAIRFDDDGPLSWLTRTGDGQGWVAHASPAWSRDHLEETPDEIIAALEASVRMVLPGIGTRLVAQAHRWRYAQVEQASATAFAWDPDLRLGLCGDWRLGPRVESAWLSGNRLAEAIGAFGGGAAKPENHSPDLLV